MPEARQALQRPRRKTRELPSEERTLRPLGLPGRILAYIAGAALGYYQVSKALYRH